MKKRIWIAIAGIVLICAVISALIILDELKSFKTGFPVKGTYQTINVFPDDMENLVFTDEDTEGEKVFYHYKQLEFNEMGYYMETVHPNLYELKIENSEMNNAYVLVAKNMMYVIQNDDIQVFEKLSDEYIFIGEDN